ncbi:succinate dehydrogenase assembly factor 2, mitochondrial [Trichoderma asperellum]|uniref:Succinate dehydrogenase assembly factor 2, mitochondrial n=1 Tax=Trichoderma asperellum TaxID=101201 RepID=A0A6V8QUY5_TRIAP|nr:Flavinator of succinate dehydrogenase-domain-containing protein [Trichoderma asperelloides]GFP56095.1 succinate dehydrogenase assembly factor 2, mitochondrial [Trichoderma asperellum]
MSMSPSVSAAMRPVAAPLRCFIAASSPMRTTLLQRCAISTTALRRSDNSTPGELQVGELQGATFRVEPLRRVGEDDATKRARLLYQSRKRGTLESDLLLSTFASQYLPTMTTEELTQYDLFLDENDWDIYYWATQKEPNSSTNPSVTSSPASASSGSEFMERKQDELPKNPPKGEWAQTVGNFKPAYRPVPQRWKDSQILEKLRAHVRSKSVNGGEGKGMAFMPPLES